MSSKLRFASRANRRCSLQAALRSLPAWRTTRARPEHVERALVQELEGRVLLSTVTVTSGSDAGTGTLRAALTAAAPGDTIDFAPAIREVDLTTAGLTLAQNVTLVNDQGTGTVTINGGSTYTVFSVNTGVTASIYGLTITAGSGTNGGGVYNNGTLALTNDTLTANSAGTGAGIYNDASGNLTLINSTVSNNTTTGGSAGGINNNGGSVTLSGDTISGNTGGQGGGGIASSGGSVSITNSTLYNNSSPDNGGGGLSIEGGSITLIDDTITGNSSQFGIGGGINSTTTIDATDTLIAGNTDSTGTGDANAGFSAASSHNLIGDGTESFGITSGVNHNQVGTGASPINPNLGTLVNNGGPTQTFALLAGSPAIGKGIAADYPGTTTPISTDQRGLARPATPDIGAFQTPGSYMITVNDTADALDNRAGAFPNQLGASITLRDAINAANNAQGTTTIVLAKTTYDFTTVDNNWYGPDALPPVYSNITLQGNGATLQRDASLPQTTTGAMRFFYVSGGIRTELPLGTLTLQNLTLTNGLAKGGDSGVGGGGMGAGGAIFNQGNLTLNGVTLTGNNALGGNTAVEVNGDPIFGGGGIGQDGLPTTYDPGSYVPTSASGGGFGGSFPVGTYGGGGGGGGGGGFDALGGLTGGGHSGLGGNLGGQGFGGDAGTGGGGSPFGSGGISFDNGGGFGGGGGGRASCWVGEWTPMVALGAAMLTKPSMV